jgi:SAM-dependent methyltransferase
MKDSAHYREEQQFWDQKGRQDYCSLSSYDQSRIINWIDWRGGGRLLDIGGGSGMISRLLAKQSDTDCVCMDISLSMLKHSPVPSVQGDALRLPFRSESFDLVIAAAFFHHLPGLEPQLLNECYRVLKPGGRLIGYDPNGHCLQNRLFMTGGPLRLSVFSPDERPIFPAMLNKQIETASFSKFEHFVFSFRNRKMTAFEAVQRFILSPVAIGPLSPLLERWIFWRAWKSTSDRNLQVD